MRLFANNKIYSQFQFDKEADFEREVVMNSKLFFGANSIYIDAKRKLETKSLGDVIPDGFLFDLSDKDNPEFYIVEVELAKHDFYKHIFPQITKFFGFYRNSKSQNELIEKIFSFVTNDHELKKDFKKYLGERETYKFIKDTIEQSQNILLVIDGDKKELPEIIETYSDTWGKIVKLILIKKFSNDRDDIYTMHPEFETLEFSELEDDTYNDDDDERSIKYDETNHFNGVSEMVKQIYNEIKDTLLKSHPAVVFNVQKSYISIRKDKNIAFFLTRKKNIRLVVMQSDDETRNEVKNHTVKTLVASVQKFWNGPSCAITLDNTEKLDEIIVLLKKLINQK